MPDEMFDIIDEEDNVIDQEMRSVVHKRGLWHRGVHVFLFTTEANCWCNNAARIACIRRWH